MQGLLNKLTDKSFDIGMVIVNREKTVVWANLEARKLTGGGLIGTNSDETMPWVNEESRQRKLVLVNGKTILVAVEAIPEAAAPGATMICMIDTYRYLTTVSGGDTSRILFGLETILDALDESIYICDQDGVLLFFNAAAEKQDGMTKAQVIGKHICDNWLLDETNSVLLRVLKTKKQELGFRHTIKSVHGKTFEAYSDAYPLFEGDRLIGVVSVTNNTSKISEAYKKLVDLQNKISAGKENHDSYPSRMATLDDIIGDDPRLVQAKIWARKAAPTRSPIMICGETGTGKELFAQGIHLLGRHDRDLFLPVNCSAIPETLLESILFGTVRGAYTGAVDRPGLFEEASEGTIFLDEINSMGLQLQAKMLRILEDGKVRRVGGVHEIKVHPKVISAINVPPLKAIEDGTLRKDLFYRLAAVFIQIPPLRERVADIETLVAHFVAKHCQRLGQPLKKVSPRVIQAFRGYSWPGNVRELEHCIENALIISPEDGVIDLEHLPSYFLDWETEAQGESLILIMQAYEKRVLINKLAEAKGHVARAAGLLGITRQGLEYKLKKYNVEYRRRKR